MGTRAHPGSSTSHTGGRSLAPSILAAAVILLIALGVGFYGAAQTDGHWGFALDDSYIHLAMARTLADHGIWGVTPAHFSATSSSPLYTLLLAGTFLGGIGGEAWAWIFSICGGVAATYLLTKRASQSGLAPTASALAGIACCIAIWLPETMATGMEHTLHICAVLMIALLLERQLASESPQRASLWLMVMVFVASGLRYETLFLLPALVWILWRSDLKRLSLSVLVCGVLPVFAVGVVYMLNGEWPLPNSVILKGVEIEGGLAGHLTRLLRQLHQPPMLALSAIAILQLVEMTGREQRHRRAESALPILFLFTAIAHAALARPDRRYMGYVLALGIWSGLPALVRWYATAREAMHGDGKARRAMPGALMIALVIMAALPFTEPFLDLGRLPRLGQDIYAQQIQVARFLSTQFPNETVALNDIGATAWAGKNDILDLWGLADNEVAGLRLSGEYGPAQMERLARERDVQVVAIYSHWFLRDKGLPEQWKLVGRWQIPGELQVNSASNAVDFFATTPDAVEPLRRKLQAFSAQLPGNVRVIM